MILEKYIKQPSDIQDYPIDYSEYLAAFSDAGDSAVVTVDDPGLTITTWELLNGGTVVNIWTSGGVDGTSYKITCKLLTAGGRSKEAEILVKVKDY